MKICINVFSRSTARVDGREGHHIPLHLGWGEGRCVPVNSIYIYIYTHTHTIAREGGGDRRYIYIHIYIYIYIRSISKQADRQPSTTSCRIQFFSPRRCPSPLNRPE